MLGKPDGAPWIQDMPYSKWVHVQKMAKRLNAAKVKREAQERADLAKVIAAELAKALPTNSGGGGEANLQPVLDKLAQVPTAVQNGQAAREAIIRE